MNKVDWEAPPLSAEDQALVDAYREIGRTLDDLPYTDDFERLVSIAGRGTGEEAYHNAWLRLASLRKQGRLPRLFR